MLCCPCCMQPLRVLLPEESQAILANLDIQGNLARQTGFELDLKYVPYNDMYNEVGLPAGGG